MDEVIHVRHLSGGDHFFIGRVRSPIADVLHDGAVVQPGILQDHAEQFTQVFAAKVADVMSIHQDFAAVHVIEAHQQFDHGGLPGSGRTDDGDLVSGLCLRREIVDNRLLRVVAEVDILELDVTFHRIQFDG